MQARNPGRMTALMDRIEGVEMQNMAVDASMKSRQDDCTIGQN